MGIRSFVSIELSEGAKAGLHALAQKLKLSGADVKWARPESLHATLKFLGDARPELIPVIKERLKLVAADHKSFTIALRGLGFFPNGRSPRIVWVGMDAPELIPLQTDIEIAMEALGFEKENRAFKPHLTIGRVSSQRGRDALIKSVKEIGDAEFGRIEAASVCLMKSELHPSGAKYSVQAEAGLGDTGQRKRE